MQNISHPHATCRTAAVIAGIATAGLLVAGVAGRIPTPIGHWQSDAAHDAFLESYQTAFADLPTPGATLDIRTSFGVVRVYRFDGTGNRAEPLVLLPGRSSATPVWADNLPGLMTLGDVYAIDLLGEPGMSLQDRPIKNDDDQAAWLHQVLEALPEAAFNLVGLSIGGWTATNLAIREPELIASVTLIDPVLVFADMPIEVILRSIPASVSWLPKAWRDDFNSWTAGGAPVEDVPVARMIESGMQSYATALPAPTRIPERAIATLGMPVLAIIAGESVMHDAQAAVEVAEGALRRGTVRLLPGASHAANGEYPDVITAQLSRFLQDEW